ncbi:MAG: pyridoxamine 5'-phosphate oxidase family protein [Solirubrobacterales bacterium]
MSADEQAELLAEERVVVCTSNGVHGWPHSMPLWFVVRGGEIWAWTYRSSQKVRNLERDRRATLLVEAGEQYHELRGIQVEAEAEIIGDTERVLDLARELTLRYAGGGESLPEDAEEALRRQAPKRVALRFEPQRTVSWDHRKLGGTY